MHALTCEVLQAKTFAYALIPTYYDPARYVACKVYIEHAWHSDTSIFYHCSIVDLYDSMDVLLQTLPVCLFRCIERKTGRVVLSRPRIMQFDPTRQLMLSKVQEWQRDYVIDVPAPFVCSTKDKLREIHEEVLSYYKSMVSKVSRFNITT
jgi:hypothetical protein